MKKKRNLIALAMISNPLFRTKVSKTAEEKQIKKDVWSRDAKHKNKKTIDPSDGLFYCVKFFNLILNQDEIIW